MYQVSVNAKLKIKTLKICQRPNNKLFVRFEFYLVRLSWCSLCRVFIEAQNWDLCQVLADTNNLNSTLLIEFFFKFDLNWVRLSWFFKTCPLTDRVGFSIFLRSSLTADWQLLTVGEFFLTTWMINLTYDWFILKIWHS